MKNYLEYNFDAIRGAYVEMNVRDGKGNTIHPSGKIIYREKNTILIESEGKLVYHYYIYDITPGSLTAEIKVEDMTLKQLEKEFCLDPQRGISVERKNGVIVIRDFDCEEGIYSEESLTDYIDCTEWGWKK